MSCFVQPTAALSDLTASELVRKGRYIRYLARSRNMGYSTARHYEHYDILHGVSGALLFIGWDVDQVLILNRIIERDFRHYW